MSTSVLVDRVTTGAHGTFSLSMDGVGIVGGVEMRVCIVDSPAACPPVLGARSAVQVSWYLQSGGKRRAGAQGDADAVMG